MFEVGKIEDAVPNFQGDFIMQANNKKISILEKKCYELNDQLKVTEKDKAKLTLLQVMKSVMTMMYWAIFSEKKKNKKYFQLSDIENQIKKLSDASKYEKEEKYRKIDILNKYKEKLGENMEDFITKFKDDCFGIPYTNPIIQNKKDIEDAVSLLFSCSEIDEDDVIKLETLAKIWEELKNV